MQFNSFRLFTLILSFAFLASSGVSAQEKNHINREIGDVTMSDFSQYDQSYDSTAPAIVFFDQAKVSFDRDFNVYMDRHTRLKVLNESGLDYGDVQLIYNKEVGQKIDDIEAYSYNVKEGELVKRKVGRKEVFDEKLVEDIFEKKFTLPNLEAGSIIEYAYRKRLGNPFQMPDWKFHKEIPVEYSSINMRIPWRFNYHMVFKGTDQEYDTDTGEYSRGGDEGYYVNISKSNLPPVEDLPLIESRDNFISELYTQLNYAYRDNGFKHEYLKDWEQISDEIRMHSDIGRQRSNRAIRRKTDELIEGASSDMEKASRIFEFVSESIVFNGRHQVISGKGIRNTFKDNSGSSGDINLLLHKMLDRAEVNVSYGLTSTRAHGMVLTDYPIVNQFNHIVTVAEIEGQVYILDASEGNRSFNMPPVKDLYQYVYVVQEDGFGWIETLPKQNSISEYNLTYQISSSGKISGNVIQKATGYSAERMREKLNENDHNEVSEALLKDYDVVHIDTTIVRGVDYSANATAQYTEFELDGFKGDSLREVNYFNPLLFLTDEKNILERPERKFPVYFPYPLQEIKHVNITLPEGYMVDEVPESKQIVLPENKGSLNFQVQSTDSTVSISSNLNIGTMFFPVEDYKELRNLFVKLSESHTTPVVIKRSSSE